MSIQTNKLKLIHKKLVLAKALKSLRHLIAQSHEKEKEKEREEDERRSPASKLAQGLGKQMGAICFALVVVYLLVFSMSMVYLLVFSMLKRNDYKKDSASK